MIPHDLDPHLPEHGLRLHLRADGERVLGWQIAEK